MYEWLLASDCFKGRKADFCVGDAGVGGVLRDEGRQLLKRLVFFARFIKGDTRPIQGFRLIAARRFVVGDGLEISGRIRRFVRIEKRAARV